MLSRMEQEKLVSALTDLRTEMMRFERSSVNLSTGCSANVSAAAELFHEKLTLQRCSFFDEIFGALQEALEELPSKSAVEREELARLCNEILEGAICELKNEPVKKEIVFLPYKASMWDSLESIWRAAYLDRERCNVHVVPIPYADLTEDRQAREWHYEAKLFPKDVPTTHYSVIDLEKLHPDVIYIHNPYDYGNLLTSIDSNYYSEKLKNYTECLVYVPYFVVGARWPEVHNRLVVYQNMDWMIVQRERMPVSPALPQLSEIFGKEERYMDEFIPAEKLLSLGAPKIDRLFYCESHKVCPASWKQFIQGRKVILYNTSLSSLHGNGFLVLKKMKYIFSCFQEHKEVALLWRPHPLFEADLERFLPELLPEYHELKKWFIEEKIGILDDTPDAAMAVANSDAYLGESSSSVVSMFGFVGKPIFLADAVLLWENPTEEQRSEIVWSGLTYEWKNVFQPEKVNWRDRWFIVQGYNAFCHFDTDTETLSPILSFGDQPFGGGTYSGYCYYEGKFYFSPNRAHEILIFDPETGEQYRIPYDNPFPDGGNYGGIIPYRNRLFFLPARYSAMLMYDIESGGLTYYHDVAELLKAPEGSLCTDRVGGTCIRENDSLLFIAALQSNRVVAFDMECCSYQSYEVGPQNSTCSGIIEETPHSDIFWLFPWQMGPIRRWNRRTGECEVIENFPEGFKCGVNMFNGKDHIPFIGPMRRLYDDQVWLFPAYSNMILRLQLSTKTIDKIDLPLPYPFGARKSSFYTNQSNFVGAFLWDAKRFAVQVSSDRSLYIIDPDTMEFENKHMRLPMDVAKSLVKPMEESFGPVGPDFPYAMCENPMCRNVGDFISYVHSGKHDKEAQKRAFATLANNADGTCGETVHKYIMETLDK